MSQPWAIKEIFFYTSTYLRSAFQLLYFQCLYLCKDLCMCSKNTMISKKGGLENEKKDGLPFFDLTLFLKILSSMFHFLYCNGLNILEHICVQ